MFLPAPFDLVELDDGMLAEQQHARRLLLHANGLVAERAEQVLLGWISSAQPQAVTATRRYAGPISPKESGRSDAVYFAGNLAPDGVDAPLLSRNEWAQLQATSGTLDPRWHQAAVTVNDGPTTVEVVDVDLGSFG